MSSISASVTIATVAKQQLTIRLLAEIQQGLHAYLPAEWRHCFVIGAFANQLWFDRHQRADHRVTRDIDIVVGVPAYGAYRTLRDRLAEEWDRVTATPRWHVLRLDDKIDVDLLPFEDYLARREGQEYEEVWSGPQELVGFREVAQNGTTVYSVNGVEVRSATVPAIIGLKLIAFDDRPEVRIKDARDIGQLIRHYPDFEDENIWENHHDLFEEGVEMDQAGQIALGREVRAVFDSDAQLTERLAQIVERLISGRHTGIGEIAAGLGADKSEVNDVLNRFLQGFRQNPNVSR